MRAANHNLSFSTDSKKPDSKGRYAIYVQYKYKKIKKSKVTPIRIPMQSWDKKNNWIKGSHEKKLEIDRENLNRLKDRFKHVRYSMAEGKMTIDEGFNYILNKTNDELLTDFIEKLKPKAKLSQSTIDKHRMNLNAVESLFKRLGYDHLQGLTFVHLNSLDNVKEIASIIKEEGGFKQNTIAGYLKTLDKLTDLNNSPLLKPFSTNRLVPSETAGDNNPVFYDEILEGLVSKVNTIHQFTGFMWWLYSFCLMGMDGKDIVSLSEKDLCDKPIDSHFDLEDYFPTAGAFYKRHFVNRLHVEVKRAKSDVRFTMMINLFPTLMIRDIIHRLIKATHPEIAYDGEDRIRLFNFDIHSDEGRKKWENLRKGWSDAQRKCFGFTTQQARHTVTRVGQDLGVSKIDLNAQLGHKEKGVMKHYLSEDQVRLDVIQTHIIQEFGVLDILKVIYEDFLDRTELINSVEVPYIHKDDFEQTVNMAKEKPVGSFVRNQDGSVDYDGEKIDWKNMKKYNYGVHTVFETANQWVTADVNLRLLVTLKKILTPFSRADEWNYERLWRRENERRWEKVNGIRQKVEPSFNQLSPELQELIKQRFKTINPEGNFDALELGEKYL